MTISSCDADAAACDLLVRLLVANRLSLDLFETVVGFTPDAVAAVLAGAAVPLWPGERETLALLAAILVRLEIRSGYDARIVRQLLDTPQPGLDGATPLAAMATGSRRLERRTPSRRRHRTSGGAVVARRATPVRDRAKA